MVLRKVLKSKIYKEIIKLCSKKKKSQKTQFKKLSKGLEYTFLPRSHVNAKQVYEKALNIINCQGKADQNHNEMSPHS